jgi:two-component system OmpR family sensor kinase
MRRWWLAAAPLALGALLGGVLALLGERRMIEVAVAIPLVFVVVGALASIAIVAALLVRRSREARIRERESARAAGSAAAAAETLETERQRHRRFLARLDHELKNPLTAIRATAAAAGTEDPHWSLVDSQARRLSDLVRDLRKLAELETRALEREHVDLEALIVEAVDALAAREPAAGGRIRLEVTRVPWPVPPVSADLDLLSLAVDNVLGNAAKYSSAGPIEVRLREESGTAVIEVADSGRGVPEGDLPQVFDELARAANARDVAGSGLGLTLVQTVLSRHGGSVSLRSVEGAGTVVRMGIPVGDGRG